jgi:hypothetical protein
MARTRVHDLERGLAGWNHEQRAEPERQWSNQALERDHNHCRHQQKATGV